MRIQFLSWYQEKWKLKTSEIFFIFINAGSQTQSHWLPGNKGRVRMPWTMPKKFHKKTENLQIDSRLAFFDQPVAKIWLKQMQMLKKYEIYRWISLVHNTITISNKTVNPEVGQGSPSHHLGSRYSAQSSINNHGSQIMEAQIHGSHTYWRQMSHYRAASDCLLLIWLSEYERRENDYEINQWRQFGTSAAGLPLELNSQCYSYCGQWSNRNCQVQYNHQWKGW